MFAYLSEFFSGVALLFTAYFAMRKEGKEEKEALLLEKKALALEGQALIARMNKLETEQANQIARQTGFQTEIENVADYGKRERQVMADNHHRDHETVIAAHHRDYEALKEQIKDVPNIRELLYRMVERMENFNKTVEKLDTKTDRIVELLTHK